MKFRRTRCALLTQHQYTVIQSHTHTHSGACAVASREAADMRTCAGTNDFIKLPLSR